jgi:hypothetical protein
MTGRRFWISPILVAMSASVALAQTKPAPFSCAVQPDGVSVRVSISNPHANDAHCTAHCEFNTTKAGTRFIVECGTSIPANASDRELCVKTFDSGRVVKLLEGKGECLNSAVKQDDGDEDSDALIQRLQKQSQDFIDAVKKKQP